MEWVIVIIIWIALGFLCEYLGNQKGQKGCFIYGLLLGLIGVIIVLCLKDKSSETPSNNSTSKYEQLEKLEQLKKDGTITVEEFETEKTKLLK